ncbi:NADPH:quinone oxidoreductase family protein [Virgibacillus sp. NKC19-16]|uniref:quinone oxidoreductase family protein n=1 Tax=Virgibacillus salidurans TaxID=2831673 RepID=UPI001F370C8E|nr:NADPH:quinone oxidoreductase family protein [Virgibacillus sp. NKC19-16]UJL45497.1 NADPH:quinone oxidoreductase family protein [Virgibacillus sp. NKC19-16]
MKAVQFKQFGGPDVLEVTDVDTPLVGDNDVLIEVKAIGVNYADTARRDGAYVVPTELPFIPGTEVAGVVVEVGAQVQDVEKGTRAVALIGAGGYAEYAVVPANTLIPVPADVSDEKAVALPLQGLSAYHILKTMGRLDEGETVLVHAASGGVGLLALQLAKIFGAGKVIATASTPEKLDLAEKMGANHLVNYSEEGWEDEILELTDGKGVDVALEMVGGDVFHKTRKCLADFGRLVIYGAASGEQAKFHPSSLMERNQSVIGFFLPQIMKKPELFRSSLQELLDYVNKGQIELTIGGIYDLEEAKHVHQLFQERRTKGKIVLLP